MHALRARPLARADSAFIRVYNFLTPVFVFPGRAWRGCEQKKDPNAPKRPMSAYLIYSNEVRERVRKANPDKKIGEVSRRPPWRAKKEKKITSLQPRGAPWPGS